MKPTEFQFQFFIILLFIFINFTKLSFAKIPDYCLTALNVSDCMMEPQTVFYYYQAGSRCEEAIWRGCPTMNIFPNEAECSSICIYNTHKSLFLDEDDFLEYSCTEPLDTEKCSDKEEKVYTYDSSTQKCVLAKWRGCPTANKFPDESTCQKICVSNHQYEDWKDEVQAMKMEDINSFKHIVDEVDESFTISKLKSKGLPVVTTEFPVWENTPEVTTQGQDTTTLPVEEGMAVLEPTTAPVTAEPTTAPATAEPTTAPETAKPTTAPATAKTTPAVAATSEKPKPLTEKPTEVREIDYD